MRRTVISLALLAAACGSDGKDLAPVPAPAETSTAPSRPTTPDPTHDPPPLEDTHVVVPSSGLPPAYFGSEGISNNNLDVVRHAGRVFLAIRNGKFHFASPDTRLFIFSSVDEVTWELEAKIDLGHDLREPRLLSYAGRLFLYFANLGVDQYDFTPHGMMMTEYLAPGVWTDPAPFYKPGEPYIGWRVRVLGGKPYMLAYDHGEHEYDASGKPITIEFLTSDDGVTWGPVDPSGPVVSSGGGSETDVAFDDHGDLYAVIRNESGDETGWGSKLCYAPRDQLGRWTCNHDSKKYDSPYMFAYQGEIFLFGRRNLTDDGNFELDPGETWSASEALKNLEHYSANPKRCSLWQLDRATLTTRFIEDLPSRGDTCFVGQIQSLTDYRVFQVYNYSSPIDGPDVTWNMGQLGQTNIYRTTMTLWLGRGAACGPDAYPRSCR